MSREDEDSGIGWLGLLAVGSLFVWAHHKAKERESEAQELREQEKRRRNTKCKFVDGISESDFSRIAFKVTKKIRRVKNISVSGPFIYGEVDSQSGISTWDFCVDFNDYGHITGKYWIRSDNTDSSIPDRIGELISDELDAFLNGSNVSEKFTEYDETIEEIDAIAQNTNVYISKEPAKQKDKNALALAIVLFVISFLGYNYYQSAKRIPIGVSSVSIIDQDCHDIYNVLTEAGFTHVTLNPLADLTYEQVLKENCIESITVNGDTLFFANNKYPYNADIIISYHELMLVSAPMTSKAAKGLNYDDVETAFLDAGFVNIVFEPIPDVVFGWFAKVGEVDSITIDGINKYDENELFRPDVEVIIKYHISKN